MLLQSRGSAGLPHCEAPVLPEGHPAQLGHSAHQPSPQAGVVLEFLLLGANSLLPLLSCSPLRPASSAWQLILQMLPPSVQSTQFEGKVKLSELQQGLGS